MASRAKGNEDKSSKPVKDEVMKDLLETRKDLRGIPRGDQYKKAAKEIGKKMWRRRRFHEKEIRTEPACARHRSRKGASHKQEDACGQSKPVSWERLADGDDEVLQQSVQRPRKDHRGDPAQRDSISRRLAQGTRANRASRHLPGNSFESFKKLKNGKNIEDGVTEKPERKMHNQRDRSKSVGQVQTDCMFDDTKEIDGLRVVEHVGAAEVWKFPDGVRTRQSPTARSRLRLASGRKAG